MARCTRGKHREAMRATSAASVVQSDRRMVEAALAGAAASVAPRSGACSEILPRRLARSSYERSSTVVNLAFVFIMAGCGAEAPTLDVDVTVGAAATPIAELTRLRMVVRRCGKEDLAYAADLKTEQNATLDAAVIPGDAFYVWIQGWVACDTDECTPDQDASDGMCRCVGAAPPVQRMVSEGCTGWLRLDGGSERISIEIGQTSSSCPPTKPRSCDEIAR